MLLTICVLLGVFFVLVMLGVPIAVSIGLATVSTLLITLPWGGVVLRDVL